MEGSMWMPVLMNTLVVSVVMMMVLRIMRRRSYTPKDGMKWPPGPSKLPIIGNLHLLGKGGSCLHLTLAKLAEVYGNVMTVWMGSSHPIIVVTGRDAVWEVLVTKSSDYASRHMPFLPRSMSDRHTISTSDSGPLWNSLRKGLTNGPLTPLTMSAQSDFQESDISLMIQSIKEESTFSKTGDGTVSPLPHLKRAVICLLARLVFGFEFSDESFVQKLDKTVDRIIHVSSRERFAVAALSYLSRYIPFLKTTVAKIADVAIGMIVDTVAPHLSSSPPPYSYLHFLRSQNLSEQHICLAIFEVFFLGVDSTASTAMWALAFLIHHKAVQEKLYQEITTVTDGGPTTIVKAEDVSKLHYLQAVVKEILRMKPIAPLAVAHKAAKDTDLSGFKVSKGTPLLVNLYQLHYDPEVWPQPHRFMPDRFLSSSSWSEYHKSFLPFGGGMRVCAGMEVGKLQISLVVANLVRAFQWSSAVDGQLPDLTEELTATSALIQMKTPLSARVLPRF